MSYDTLNYMVEGGADWQVGGTFNIKTGATFSYNGVDVTALLSNYSTGIVNVATTLQFAEGSNLNLDSETKSGNTATSNKMACKITTAALTTAAGATQDIVITNSQAAAGDFVASANVVGGSNTKLAFVKKTVVTSTTITVTLVNMEASAPLDGTVILDVILYKA